MKNRDLQVFLPKTVKSAPACITQQSSLFKYTRRVITNASSSSNLGKVNSYHIANKRSGRLAPQFSSTYWQKASLKLAQITSIICFHNNNPTTLLLIIARCSDILYLYVIFHNPGINATDNPSFIRRWPVLYIIYAFRQPICNLRKVIEQHIKDELIHFLLNGCIGTVIISATKYTWLTW